MFFAEQSCSLTGHRLLRLLCRAGTATTVVPASSGGGSLSCNHLPGRRMAAGRLLLTDGLVVGSLWLRNGVSSAVVKVPSLPSMAFSYSISQLCRLRPTVTTIPLPALSSCECLAFKLKDPFSLTVLLIYWPPKSNSAFISEIPDLLTTLCTSSANIIILGDMNIHVDTPSCHRADEFLQEKCNMHIDFFRQKVYKIRSHLSATSTLFPQIVDPPSGISIPTAP